MAGNAGNNVISFRFHLSNDSEFEIICVNYSVKKSQIMSSYVFDYITEADVAGLWSLYDYPASTAEESELPVYNK